MAQKQNRSGTGEPGTEHTDAEELAFGREPVDDARAGRAVIVAASFRLPQLPWSLTPACRFPPTGRTFRIPPATTST